MFIKMSRGVVYDQKFLEKHGLDGYLKVPMSVESCNIPDQLSAQLQNMIHNFKGIAPKGESDAREYVETFISELKKNSEVLDQFVDKELIVKRAME